MIEYEELKDLDLDIKEENGGVWISWDSLWKIDGMCVRNAQKCFEEEFDSLKQMMFQSFVGQRILIEDISKLFKPDKEEKDDD